MERHGGISIVERNASVAMVRDHLEEIPEYAPPPGYAIRWYQPGDERLWVDIHLKADRYNVITHELYIREFGSDHDLLHQRQFFLMAPNGTAIGTATAWFDDNYRGMPYGRVHWVAIVPDMQGQGLGNVLMTTVCRRLRELGHKRAYLTTSTARIPAIHLYLKFGFVPDIHSLDGLDVWCELREVLKRPATTREL